MINRSFEVARSWMKEIFFCGCGVEIRLDRLDRR